MKIMIIKENIGAKRQYTPPAIHVRVLQMESMLAAVTPTATGPGMDGDGGNFVMSKKASYLEDDQTEE